MVAATDKATIEKLTEMNKVLMAQLKATITTIQRLTEDNQWLLGLVERNLPHGHKQAQWRQKPWEDDALYDPEGYCWTHGFKCRKGHTSATCGTPHMGHKREATRRNIMGGSLANKEWTPK